ncbi:hypothetical protein M9H77_30860 [Catharanthus roseus]|uniref:Uncharacterized protein n=1 Tax=Catharanthus roseus TaxID=4058 RepID=A0ACC0A0Q8_CATRO|nr:hypothetical protein M9H77_30860 [Catharanthus roseus]
MSGSPKRGHQNQVPASRSQHQPNTIRALNYKQPHSYINGQNRLQTLGAPTRSALGHTSVLRPSLSGSTLRVKNSSTSSEEAVVQGTSHVQCNPLTRPFSYVFTNRKANCPAIITDSRHKHFRAQKVLIRQSSHAYENFTNMPMLGLCSCMLKHVTFQDQSILQLMQILQRCHVYIHACQII